MDPLGFDRDAYLQRIKLGGAIEPALDELKALHRAHFYTLPFENFDIQQGRGINLEPGALFHKLVRTQRGGYCFELNGLFLMALKAFGFDARALLARVHVSGTPTGRGHQISLITLRGEQWVADVGFGGDTPRAPIPLKLDQPEIHAGQTVRLVERDRFGFLLQTLKAAQWQDLYSFDLSHVCPADIEYGNHYTSTHPDSFFTSARVAALPVENGVITLFNSTLNKSIAGEDTVQELAGGQAYLDALKIHFGIDLEVPYDHLRPLEELVYSGNSQR
jgi:N-hydroxyarylamine O-acetyltransferase